MNIRDLEYLVAVADYKHFGKAARKVHVSQPTLSMQIRKLEEYLGTPLLERSNKEVLVTAFGEKVLVHAREILNQVKEITELGKLSAEPNGGDIHIGIIPTLAPYLLPIITPALRKEFPKVKFFFSEYKTENLLEYLIHGKIDLILAALPLSESNIDSISLFDEEFLLAVPKKHDLSKQKSASLKELKGHELLLVEDGHCFRDQALTVCKQAKAKEYTDFMGTSIETLLSMVAAGSGITLIPQLAARRNNKYVDYLPFKRPAPKRSIALAHRNKSHRSELFIRIAEVIKGKVQKG